MYKLDKWFVIEKFVGKIIFNKQEFICLHTVKWFQILQSKINSSICSQLNGFKYSYLT